MVSTGSRAIIRKQGSGGRAGIPDEQTPISELHTWNTPGYHWVSTGNTLRVGWLKITFFFQES